MKTVSPIKQKFIVDFFGILETSCNYCILRNYEMYPEKMGDDIDVMVDAPNVDVVKTTILPIVEHLGWDYHVKFYKDGFAPIVCFYTTDDTVDTCQIDIYTKFLWRGNLFADGEAVLASRWRYKSFLVASHGADLAITLSKEFMGSGKVRAKYREKMASFAKDDKKGFYSVLESIYGKQQVDLLYKYCIEEAFDRIDALAKPFQKRVMNQNRVVYIKKSLGMTVERIKNWFKPEGKLIAFVGPDGSGKTTLIGKMDDYMERFFPHNSKIFHRRYEVFPELHTGLGISSMGGKIVAGKERVVEEKPGKPKRKKRSLMSIIASLAVVFYYTLEYSICSLWAFRLVRKRTLILYDRYYYDWFVQPATRDVVWPIRHFLLALVRKPDLIVHLIASGDHIFKRKQDLNAIEIDNQNYYMSRILKSCKNVEDLNMEQLNADQVAAEVFRMTIEKFYGKRPRINPKKA